MQEWKNGGSIKVVGQNSLDYVYSLTTGSDSNYTYQEHMSPTHVCLVHRTHANVDGSRGLCILPVVALGSDKLETQPVRDGQQAADKVGKEQHGPLERGDDEGRLVTVLICNLLTKLGGPRCYGLRREEYLADIRVDVVSACLHGGSVAGFGFPTMRKQSRRVNQ